VLVGSTSGEGQQVFTNPCVCTTPPAAFKAPAAISCCLKYKYNLEKPHNQGKGHGQNKHTNALWIAKANPGTTHAQADEFEKYCHRLQQVSRTSAKSVWADLSF